MPLPGERGLHDRGARVGQAEVLAVEEPLEPVERLPGRRVLRARFGATWTHGDLP